MRTDEERLRDILDATKAIEQYRDDQEQPADLRYVWLVHHLMIIGEAASRLDESTRQAMPGIPWDMIKRMRNILVHVYFGIDEATVERVAREEMDPLARAIQKYLAAPFEEEGD